MEHPTIKTAFENADKRKRKNKIIYVTFLRLGIFYKDTCYILIGTREEVEIAVQKEYKEVEEEKRDFPRAEHISLLDTPFDSFCNRSCISSASQCKDTTKNKCGSMWIHKEHDTKEDLQQYTDSLPYGQYGLLSFHYM
jgi:hypothetical protein